MKVSVIIPLYNMGQSIGRTIGSILNQTYRDLEIIVVDDGSQDNSYEICQTIAQTHDLVHVYHTENQGSGPARNFGIEKATGDFAYFPDADDYLEPNAIEIMVNAVNRFQCDLVVFGYRFASGNKKVYKEKRYDESCFDGDYVRKHYENHCVMSAKFSIQGAPWNKFFSLKIIREHNVEYPALRRHQDEVFIARYVSHSQKICFISDLLYTYYTNDLKADWEKYPLNYLDILEQLRNYKVAIITGWNPDNHLVKEYLDTEYISNYIKALKLIFNQKYELSKSSRLAWIIEQVQRKEFLETINRAGLGGNLKKQRSIINCIKKRRYVRLYYLLSTKVFLRLHANWVAPVVKKAK